MSLDIELAVPEAYHLRRFLVGHQMGRYGPTLRISDHMAQGASNKPEGPACFAASRAERHVDLRIHGPGREWLAGRAMGLLGLLDDPYRFDPKDRVVRRMWRQSYGMHLPRLPLVFDRLVQIVLLQLVTWKSGLGTWRRLVETFGQEAPGPCELKVPPSPTALVALDADERVALGIQPRQARTLRRAAKEASRIESAAERGSQALGDVRGSALADSDAVLVGDYNLPSSIAWALAGEDRADDERMLELLEPFRGHRVRVIRLVWMSGVKRVPQRGRSSSYR